MKKGGTFYNFLEEIEKVKEVIKQEGYDIWEKSSGQTLITGKSMPPYGEILDNRIITLVKYDDLKEKDNRKEELKNLEKILDNFIS